MCQDRTENVSETHFTCKGKKYPVIGLTGGVGAGKSTVLSILQEKYGFHVIQADLVARTLMEPGEEAYKAVCAFLGPKILLEDGQINRSAMAEIIFKDPSKRAKVDSLTHPLVWKAVKKETEEYSKQPVVIEAAIPSKEFRDICDEMWYLYTSREERIRRLKEGRGYSDEKIAGIMANQASEEEFRNCTDCEINNSGTAEETSLQIQKLLCGKDNETA